MSPRLQSAVYRCPLLVEKPFDEASATYHSPLYRPQSETPYFTAWPELGGNPNQPSCLTTLMRARYYINRGTLIDLEAVAAEAEKYLSSQDSIEPKVKEVALAIIKHHQTLWRYLPKITAFPPILFGVEHVNFTDLKLKDPVDIYSLSAAHEVAIQGLIYGNLIHNGSKGKGNLFGMNDAFSLGHEAGHNLARRCHCGHALNELSRESHSILLKLAEDNLSPEQITEEWSKFWAINDCIYRLAEKFEPIEEIFANYVGLRFSPISVRNEVEALIKDHLIEKKWIEAYNAFADVCDNAEEEWFTAAFLIIDAISRMLTRFDFLRIDIGPAESATNLLHNFVEILKIIWSTNIEDIDDEDNDDLDKLLELLKLAENKAAAQINRMLERANIPQEIYWFVSEVMHEEVIPKHLRAVDATIEAILNNNSSHKEDEGAHGPECHPKITLIGYEEYQYVHFVWLTQCKYYDEDYVYIRVFLESMRQQLYHRCGIVCPYGFMNKCCGQREKLKRIYELIPDEEKEYFSEPDCGHHS